MPNGYKTRHRDRSYNYVTTAKPPNPSENPHFSGWLKLANAILVQAAADYRKYPSQRAVLGRWFRSKYADLLSRGTAVYIHDKLKKEPNGAYTDRRLYQKITRKESDLL